MFGKSGTRTTEQAESAKQDAENYISKADNSVIAFTDGSALGNPGPTGAGAAIFLNGVMDSITMISKSDDQSQKCQHLTMVSYKA